MCEVYPEVYLHATPCIGLFLLAIQVHANLCLAVMPSHVSELPVKVFVCMFSQLLIGLLHAGTQKVHKSSCLLPVMSCSGCAGASPQKQL